MKIAEEIQLAGATDDGAAARARVVMLGRDCDLLLHSHVRDAHLVRHVNFKRDSCEHLVLEDLLTNRSSLFHGFDTLDVRTLPNGTALDCQSVVLSLLCVGVCVFSRSTLRPAWFHLTRHSTRLLVSESPARAAPLRSA
jgi:hypothetical protein